MQAQAYLLHSAIVRSYANILGEMRKTSFLLIALSLSLASASQRVDTWEDLDSKCDRQLLNYNCVDERNHDTPNTIYFGLMLSFPDPLQRPSLASQYDDGHDLAPAAYLAVRQINNRSDLLQDYKIKISRFDGGCDSYTRTIVGVNKLYCSCEPIVGVIGPSCEQSSRIVSELTNHKGSPMITINYGGEPVGESPYAFGILGTNDVFIQTIAELMKLNKWNRTALLYYGLGELFSRESRGLINLLHPTEYKFRYISVIYDNFIPFREVKESFSRVIVLMTSAERRLRILCMAYHESMTFPHYQWIFREIVNPDDVSFIYAGTEYHCTKNEIMIVLNGTVYPIFNAFDVGPNSNMPIGSGISAAEYLEQYELQTKAYSKQFGVTSTASFWASAVYDAVWVLAFALNSTLYDMNTSLSDTQPGSEVFAERVRTHMLDTDLIGITGNIKFDDAGFNKLGTVNIYQYNTTKVVRIATFSNGQLAFLPNASHIFIKGSFNKHYEQIDVRVVAAIFVLTAITLGLVITAQIVNICFSNNKVIKSSSPLFNHFIFVGSYLIAIGIVFHTLEPLWHAGPTAKGWICTLVPTLLNVGGTLVLGTVSIKTWRLNQIYIVSKQLGRARDLKRIKSPYLITCLSIFIIIDLSVCVLWRIIDPLLPVRSENLGIIDNEVQIITREVCTSKFSALWLGILLGPKLLLIVASFTLAISTKLKRTEFSTVNVVILSYFLTIAFGLGIPLYIISYIIDLNHSLRVLLLCGCLDVCICICIIVLLFPFICKVAKIFIHH